jgi:hypothetical protein
LPDYREGSAMGDPTSDPTSGSTFGPACPQCWQPVILAVAGDPAGLFTAPSGHLVSRDDETGVFMFLYCPDQPQQVEPPL